jgi:hypothetical protein
MDQQTTRRGPSPSKGVRTPEEAMELARNQPGRKILVSEGHQKYGARVKANQIQAGKRGPWRPYAGEVRTSAMKQPDGTYNVYVYVSPSGEEELPLA